MKSQSVMHTFFKKYQRHLSKIALSASLISIGSSQLAVAATNPADPDKVLKWVFNVAETGFDPGAAKDLYSNGVNYVIFETLYSYDYLASPVKLIPRAAESMPEVSADAKTYTIKLKKGIYFTPDDAFNGKRRELTMADYIYTLKRLMDPKLSSPHSWLLSGKIVGLDELAEQAKKANKFNYDTKIAGLELVDKYTLRIHLTRPDFNLGLILAHNPTGAVAREVIEKYQDLQGQVMGHPVGTGPYMVALDEWVRGSKIILLANPDYRGDVWDFKGGASPEDQKIMAAMKGKRMPQIGRIEINVMIEDQSRWLAFQGGEIDIFELEGPLAPQALDNGKLKPALVKKGVQLSRIPDPETSIYYWNMQDPVWGGLSKEKIALRRSVALAHNIQEEIDIVYNGNAVKLDYPIPPGVVGYDANYKNSIQYNVAAANALLDKFGYKKGPDGFRTLPDGKPLEIRYTARSGAVGKLQTEVWKKTYDSIGIKMKEDLVQFSEMLKAEKTCQLQTRNSPWIADYPDGDNFMQLYYGPNIGSTNNGCVKLPEYDKLYEESQKLPPGEERDALYHKMARIMEVNTAQMMGFARYRNMLAQARVIGYKKHPIIYGEWMFFDVEKSK
ncbi:ABC transporter substrate-binding protein [Undibacterium sp. RTI2.1]|uniref:ABC transporter substrate-binding protein n=1 Tax=unclassified Undibacterium TaxID=2630295 RepID=UPI002AB3FF3D|nr:MULTISPECIES: ABC transporter substrate-binding protein [unclassified Undibacterium]MDY7536920.1 ABC transporter substrate-binding protein [Undibacterium sp. 5I1]MEB0031650.1 ABC transporter substrate-binding protein [Undibacterium sp. RTI2.1]MEB0117921.1 ABC transporter substrate-binding protein [Undibacterium sp. RTI2.2]MEB0230425.1 ABC transporter substrate-binding protein [Undibacterium sp. 10I3]MEB0258844.1 ABC transporter substrate-binding protein [Undibacterium sp. 5I1]